MFTVKIGQLYKYNKKIIQIKKIESYYFTAIDIKTQIEYAFFNTFYLKPLSKIDKLRLL